MAAIKKLFEKAKYGLSFNTNTKAFVGEKLKQLIHLSHFEQLVELLQIFHLLANSVITILNSRPVANESIKKDHGRIESIYHYIEQNYQKHIDVKEVAKLSHLTTAAFCQYFKKVTRMTFTGFLNQYRITQAKNIAG